MCICLPSGKPIVHINTSTFKATKTEQLHEITVGIFSITSHSQSLSCQKAKVAKY